MCFLFQPEFLNTLQELNLGFVLCSRQRFTCKITLWNILLTIRLHIVYLVDIVRNLKKLVRICLHINAKSLLVTFNYCVFWLKLLLTLHSSIWNTTRHLLKCTALLVVFRVCDLNLLSLVGENWSWTCYLNWVTLICS
jgi:hypothetical protein